jgi:energy-coupling factor transporter ATP-binding protein EcfA2
MSLATAFNRARREIGIKNCVIFDGNTGDVYLNEKEKILTLKQYLVEILKNMGYENIVYWDRIDGADGDLDSLKIVDDVEVSGDDYSLDDDAIKPQTQSGTGQYKEPKEIFSIVLKNMVDTRQKTVFILNWADYLFTSQHDSDYEENITRLSKAIRDRKVNPFTESKHINESTLIIITNSIAMLPVSLYQGNPEASIVTLPKPDRLERERMLLKIEPAFDVRLKPGETLITSDKKTEYIDILDDFTNREIIQMAKLSTKEQKLTFDKLFLLFKYGEKDNPWEKLDYTAVKKIKEELSARVVGQEDAIKKIEKVVVKAYMGVTGMHKISSRSMPKGVLFFVGPTGVGKTELSKALAKFLFGDEQACIRFDMSEYAQENSDQKLIGAPPGYVGYEEGGQLTNAIKAKPFSVILFDEIEKAAKPNPRILDIFLQILEDGRLTDSKGETVYFSESVIIFTSNLGAATVSSTCTKEQAAEQFLTTVKDYFNIEIQRPEILGRIGYSNIVPFNFIHDHEFKRKIAHSKLVPVKKAIYEKYRLDLEFKDESAFIDYILGSSDAAKGGRDILNQINDVLLDDLAMFLFKNREDLSGYRGAKITAKIKNKKLEFDFEST